MVSVATEYDEIIAMYNPRVSISSSWSFASVLAVMAFNAAHARDVLCVVVRLVVQHLLPLLHRRVIVVEICVCILYYE